VSAVEREDELQFFFFVLALYEHKAAPLCKYDECGSGHLSILLYELKSKGARTHSVGDRGLILLTVLVRAYPLSDAAYNEMWRD
jgi:hypothetical protein